MRQVKTLATIVFGLSVCACANALETGSVQESLQGDWVSACQSKQNAPTVSERTFLRIISNQIEIYRRQYSAPDCTGEWGGTASADIQAIRYRVLENTSNDQDSAGYSIEWVNSFANHGSGNLKIFGSGDALEVKFDGQTISAERRARIISPLSSGLDIPRLDGQCPALQGRFSNGAAIVLNSACDQFEVIESAAFSAPFSKNLFPDGILREEHLQNGDRVWFSAQFSENVLNYHSERFDSLNGKLESKTVSYSIEGQSCGDAPNDSKAAPIPGGPWLNVRIQEDGQAKVRCTSYRRQ